MTKQTDTSDGQLSSDARCAFAAVKLAEAFEISGTDVVFVCRSEALAARTSDALKQLLPQTSVIFLPTWDCLPYDRVQPSKEAMGRRMDAMRDWMIPARAKGILVTSLEVLLQRIPPIPVISATLHELEAGKAFDEPAFREFVARTGYTIDGIVDEPGEIAFLQDVVDIFPAGASKPMRIYLNQEGEISDLWFYDPMTQRTETSLRTMVFGPASELVLPAGEVDEEQKINASVGKRLLATYGRLDSAFALIGNARVIFDPEVDDRVDTYLAIIEEAREAQTADKAPDPTGQLYLTREDWDQAREKIVIETLGFESVSDLPQFFGRPGSMQTFTRFVENCIRIKNKVVITGSTDRVTLLIKRLGTVPASMPALSSWARVEAAPSDAVLTAGFDLRCGFNNTQNQIVLIAADNVLGPLLRGDDDAAVASLAEPELEPGDAVVHEDHGIGILQGLETTNVDGVELDAVRLVYRDDMSVLIPMTEFGKLWRYGGEPDAISLDRLHTDAWLKKRSEVQADIAVAARHLVDLAGRRHHAEATVIEPPAASYRKFVARFPYTVTTDQGTAIKACLDDLRSGMPMNRLVCGDVGYGKTEIALRTAAAVALAGRQVIVLAPTTVLARQHFSTFERRFSGLGVTVKMLSRVMSAADRQAVKDGLADGEVDIVVGTQAVLAKDVHLLAPGLLIIDEEHRFGAGEKEKMRQIAPALHTLIMTATPIPRSLQAAMVGIQEVSLLTTPPARRRPVRTSLVEFDPPSVASALRRERRRSGQSFFVVPQIDDIEGVCNRLQEIVPELTLLVAHGKMAAAEMDEVVVRFAEGKGDILISTNIIESGLDIPRANTIFVWRADRFGMAQLHQLRGRVGRGTAQGFAYMLTTPSDNIADDTRARLETIVQFDRLGSGLSIAMRDLDLRGAGDLAGEEQAGHLKKIGTGFYQKLLLDAVRSLHNEATHESDAELDLGIVGYIPADYVPDAVVRLSLYTRLVRLQDRLAVDDLADELSDRFGDPPMAVQSLLRITTLRLAATAFGVSKLSAGPLGLAISFADKSDQAFRDRCAARTDAELKSGRIILKVAIDSAEDRLKFVEHILDKPE